MPITPPIPQGTPGAGQGGFNPYTDPAYVALINGLNLSRTTAEANTRGAEDSQRRQLALLLPQIADTHTLARKGISGGMEARGIWRSGEHETHLAEDRKAEGQQVGNAQSAVAEAIADLERQLATQRAGFQNQAHGGYADAYNRFYSDQQAKAAQAEQQRAAAAQQAAYFAAMSKQQASQNEAMKQLYAQQRSQYAAPAAGAQYGAPAPAQTLAPGVTPQQASAVPKYYDSRGRPVYGSQEGS